MTGAWRRSALTLVIPASRISRTSSKKTIAEYGIDEKDFLDRLDDMTVQAFDDQCTGANPRYPLMEEIKAMYLNAYYGRKFEETDTPNADLIGSVDKNDPKQAFRRAINGIHQNV